MSLTEFFPFICCSKEEKSNYTQMYREYETALKNLRETPNNRELEDRDIDDVKKAIENLVDCEKKVKLYYDDTYSGLEMIESFKKAAGSSVLNRKLDGRILKAYLDKTDKDKKIIFTDGFLIHSNKNHRKTDSIDEQAPGIVFLINYDFKDKRDKKGKDIDSYREFTFEDCTKDAIFKDLLAIQYSYYHCQEEPTYEKATEEASLKEAFNNHPFCVLNNIVELPKRNNNENKIDDSYNPDVIEEIEIVKADFVFVYNVDVKLKLGEEGYVNFENRCGNIYYLTGQDKELRQYYSNILEKFNDNNTKTPSSHDPKNTAKFFFQFTNEEGFKYLSHEKPGKFDFSKIVRDARDTFKRLKEKGLPEELVGFFEIILNGKYEGNCIWEDDRGEKRLYNYATQQWTDYFNLNKDEKIEGSGLIRDIQDTIERFRYTYRVRNKLDTIVDNIVTKGHENLKDRLRKINLGDADWIFVPILRKSINMIFKLCDQYVKPENKVSIAYTEEKDEPYKHLKLLIVEEGVEPAKNLIEYKRHQRTGGGDINSLKQVVEGFADLEIWAKWSDGPKKWNVFNDTEEREDFNNIIKAIKKSSNDAIQEGFTFILTFYQYLGEKDSASSNVHVDNNDSQIAVSNYSPIKTESDNSKCIYLIDDDRNKEKTNFDVSYLENYSSFIKQLSEIDANAKIEDIIQDDPACILIHKSFKDKGGDSVYTYENIKRYIEDHNIPAVLFSGEDNLGKYDEKKNIVSSISKSTMYIERLEIFLKNYQDTHSIDLRLISDGPHYKVLNAIQQIIDNITELEDEDIVKKGDLPDDWKIVFNNDSEKFIKDLESKIVKKDKLQKYLNTIQRDYNSNGKKMHNWE